MKAAYIEKTGPPEVIQYGDLPKPAPKGAQALIKVEAVSVNPIDTYIRGGIIPVELPKPYVIGCDVAGTVEAVGPEATRFKPGARVWGSNQGLFGRPGTFAEYVAVDECWLYAIPEGVKAKEAAAVSLVSLTAHLGLVLRAGLRAGETIFVNGGSGGVGSAVIQMAKALGARVMAASGSEAKIELCKRLGADVAVNYKTDDVDAAVREFAPHGLNVWWETQREPNFDRIVPLMAKRGRMVLMAGRDAQPPFPVGPFYTRDLSLLGFAMFNAAPDEQRAAAGDINRWLSEGKLKANIGLELPLAKAAKAHQMQEDNTMRNAGTLTGKIILTP